MDLGREDRDDRGLPVLMLKLRAPQWISVARTETTSAGIITVAGPFLPQWISVARTETT